MKIRLNFKTPDIMRTIRSQIEYNLQNAGLDKSNEDYEEVLYSTECDVALVIDNFVKWSEYLTVEFDMETETAKVLTTKEVENGR